MVPFEADPSGVTDILGIPLGQLTLNGLAVLAISAVVFALIRGLLIPKSTHERELEQVNQRADEWKEAFTVSDKRGDTLEQGFITLEKFIRAMPQSVDEPPKGGKS